MDDGYNYSAFIGIDDDDKFYLSKTNEIQVEFKKIGIEVGTVTLSGFQHAPALAWGALAKVAYNVTEPVFDYFFQIGDDVEIISKDWTSTFVKELQKNNNVGVIGPMNLTNYNERRERNLNRVIENSFVHRTHLDIFSDYFPQEIRNWFCDNWITSVYRNSKSLCMIHKEVLCTNTVRDIRYNIHKLEIKELINIGTQEVINYKKSKNIPDCNTEIVKKEIKGKKVFSYCLYGKDKKYCLGMIRNIEQINQYYPDFHVHIHCGNDVPEEYTNLMKQEYNKLEIIEYDFTGVELMTYRFFSADREDVGFIIIRDADSRFTERCRWVIDNFISSDYNVFTVRDHPYHTSKLMAGQSGFKMIKPDLKKAYEKEWKKKSTKYWDDKHFLNFAIYDRFFEQFVVYTDVVKRKGENSVKIKLQRKDKHDFCGNVVLFDEEDKEYLEY